MHNIFQLADNIFHFSMTFILLILGFILLVVGAELLVRGASRLAVIVRISPLVIGLTVVAFGTSSPELAVSLKAAFANSSDISLGNVVGSNIFNILFVLGISSLFLPLFVSQQLVRLDVPLMIIASVLVLILGLDGNIGRVDGLLLFTGIIAYIVFLIKKSRKEKTEIVKEYTQEYGNAIIKPKRRIPMFIGFIVAGLVLLVLGSHLLVDNSVIIARYFNVSELLIGLTIIAVGTSLPELATSVIATIKGERDIAVGNVIGSNIFNLLAILGLAGLLSPNGINVTDTALRFDLPFMIAVSVACLPIFFTGYIISRWEGGLFLAYYVVYIIYLYLATVSHKILPVYNIALIVFIVPITAITLIILTYRYIKIKKLKT